jgi:cbb3-type cytochrome oxidase subunit 3
LFSSEARKILAQVITSWQVIALTITLILYLFLVFYVARTKRKKRPPKYASTGKKAPKAEGKGETPAEDGGEDELGLEEAGPGPD